MTFKKFSPQKSEYTQVCQIWLKSSSTHFKRWQAWGWINVTEKGNFNMQFVALFWHVLIYKISQHSSLLFLLIPKPRWLKTEIYKEELCLRCRKKVQKYLFSLVKNNCISVYCQKVQCGSFLMFSSIHLWSCVPGPQLLYWKLQLNVISRVEEALPWLGLAKCPSLLKAEDTFISELHRHFWWAKSWH